MFCYEVSWNVLLFGKWVIFVVVVVGGVSFGLIVGDSIFIEIGEFKRVMYDERREYLFVVVISWEGLKEVVVENWLC